MWTIEFLIQFIASLFGTLGFSLMFRIGKNHLLPATLGGGFTFFVYYLLDYLTGSLFSAAFFSSCASAIIAELFARWRKAPTVLFILPCAIPIVPGGSLYNAMFNLISKNLDIAWRHLADTLTVAIGIAGGLAAISLIFHIGTAAIAYIRKSKFKTNNDI